LPKGFPHITFLKGLIADLTDWRVAWANAVAPVSIFFGYSSFKNAICVKAASNIVSLSVVIVVPESELIRKFCGRWVTA
jgi:hypothetical protein